MIDHFADHTQASPGVAIKPESNLTSGKGGGRVAAQSDPLCPTSRGQLVDLWTLDIVVLFPRNPAPYTSESRVMTWWRPGRTYPAQIFFFGGGSFNLKCGPMKTRQGNWGLNCPRKVWNKCSISSLKKWTFVELGGGGRTTGPTTPGYGPVVPSPPGGWTRTTHTAPLGGAYSTPPRYNTYPNRPGSSGPIGRQGRELYKNALFVFYFV